VELSSAGKSDVDEYQWTMPALSEGWNMISLELSKASKIGTPDLTAINWFRIYSSGKAVGINLKTRVDAIQLVTNSLSAISTTNTNENSFSIHPNPYKTGKLSVNLSGFENQSDIVLKICNLMGQTIYEQKFNSSNNNIYLPDNLKTAVYIAHIESKTHKAFTKLIVR
jgi:hypothetical protein